MNSSNFKSKPVNSDFSKLNTKEPIFWHRPSILAQNRRFLNWESLGPLIEERRQGLERACWFKLRELLENCFYPANPEEHIVAEGSIQIGKNRVLSAEQERIISAVVTELIPWRKGPFQIFSRDIDSEWRSDFKWNRLEPHLPSLKGMKVADVGCGNGYYMLRASQLKPEFIIGLDPSERFFYAAEFLQRFIQDPRLQFEMLGADHLCSFPEFFDLVMCMGVIYHQKNPLGLLAKIKQALLPGGLLVLESQIVPGEEEVALFPKERYAKARNVYFVPTANCLKSWVHRAGFNEIEIVSIEKTNFEEQRKTSDAPFESLEDFLDPKDLSKTIEAYPAPRRAMLLARKKR